MYESQIERLRQIAELLKQAHELYGEEPPPAPIGILLGADLTSAAARTQQLINHLRFQQKLGSERRRLPAIVVAAARMGS